MNRCKVKTTMNRELGRFLYRARTQSRDSAGQIAATLGISVSALSTMEARPAEVPCSDLYRLIQHYGPEQMHQAQLALIEAQKSLLNTHAFGKGQTLKSSLPWSAETFIASIGGSLFLSLIKFFSRASICR